ncbi:MAG: SNF2 family DNA-dependent ATPase [Lentinula lateritia]|uniref:SNF2 family N-terminal domain-containing protein n=1 Tax=Lentinula lateritia TaxID=40482 RepID=A0ABQ8VVZ7_9AGAR|nr:MAG: SNF2 family DNA-dependent ATPase [Lentinula lateritia]KAJ4500499.1 SNF2 family N-terminal domain-containing protein [Lentinula lateritia]
MSTGSRLLDALDSSMFLPSTSQTTPRDPVHSLNAGSSPVASDTGPDRTMVMEARSTQMQGNMMRLMQADGDAQLVLGSPSSQASRTSRVAGAGGFGLNYDDQTPVRTIDIGGADQGLRMVEFVTQTINNASHGITVKSAVEKLGLEDLNDILPGMNVRLLPHQVIGVSWMLDRERSKYKGGILADDMGLGKTVQMIATMAMNQPSLEDEDAPTTTLIVVPAALLQQWKEEIETRTNDIMSVHVHHGKDKLKKRSEIKNYDVIITTYQTLNGDFNFPKDLPIEEESEWLLRAGGILARTKFHRAIADEAQFIRNRATRSSISLAHVQATYRWMLTGTPVTNTLADIYGLLRFGHFRPWNDWNDFNHHVAKIQIIDPPLAGQRAQAILAPLLLRRTKNSTLEGEPILKLPPKEIQLVKLDFSVDERECYDSFEKQSKIRLNKFIKERTLVKNHTYVLVMILRLRQLCCHPYLILSQTENFDDPTALMGGEAEKERARAIKAKGRPWVEGIIRQFLLRARANELLDYDDEAPDTASCPVCEEIFAPAKGRILSCGHEICLDCVLDIRNSPMEHNGIFGEGTERENLEAERKFEEANAKGHRKCPTCKTILDMGPEKIFKAIAFEPTDEELSKYADSERRRRRNTSSSHRLPSFPKKKAVAYGSSEDEGSDDELSVKLHKTFELKGLDDSDDDLPDLADIMRPTKRHKTGERNTDHDDDILDLTMDDIAQPIFSSPIKPGQSSNHKRKAHQSTNGGEKRKDTESEGGLPEALVATWSKGDDDMEPSIKMVQLLEYIKKWEAIGDKTICYSQWTSMLDLIEILFSRYGIRSLRFDGKMDRTSRDRTLVQFRKPDGPKVILISTKSGGVGLNLVAANRIVNMDLSWNYAAESQAYDRAHRIGQEKPVFVKRLIVRNTIEERMLQLQDVKVGLAEAALGEGTGNKLNKLSVKNIKFLFGMTKNNANTGNNRDSQGLSNSGGGGDDDSDDG